jgi:hypothetical protein
VGPDPTIAKLFPTIVKSRFIIFRQSLRLGLFWANNSAVVLRTLLERVSTQMYMYIYITLHHPIARGENDIRVLQHVVCA